MAFLINYFYCEMQVDEHFVIHTEIKISREGISKPTGTSKCCYSTELLLFSKQVRITHKY